MPFTPTPQHEAIFAAIRAASSNIIIEAVAGAGKTSTICEGMKCLPVGGVDALLSPAVSFLTFSRASADALASRLPRHVQATTFNSLGHRALGRMFPDSRKRRDWLDARKCTKILWDLGEKENPDFQNILRLVGLMKSVPPQEELMNLVESFINQHGFVLEEERDSKLMVLSVLQKSNALVERSIDFNDQLYLPVLLDAEFDQQDFVFVDECQDTNEIQLEILDRIARPGLPYSTLTDTHYVEGVYPSPTFFCFVGDPWQAIYGFRGANTDSMERIRQRFACKTLELSVSWRCPKAIVREVQKWMKD